MKSFALGFVKGLTNGFTRNIAMEQEARGADDARVANIENLMIQASLDPKKRVPESVGNMLKDAQGQLEKREPIDIFGREGSRLKLDMDKISNTISGLDASDMIKIGNYSFKAREGYFDSGIQKDNYTRSSMFWGSLQDHLADPKNVISFRKHFNNNAKELGFLNTVFRKNKVNYLQGYSINESTKGKDGEIKSPVYTELLRDFNIGSVYDLYDGKDSTKEDSDALSTSYETFKKNNAIAYARSGKKDLFKTTLLIPFMKGDRKFAFGYEATKEEGNLMTELADSYGYNDVNHFLFDYTTKYAPNKIFESDKGPSLLNHDEIKEGYGYLFHAIQLNKFKVNDPTLVDKQGVINYLNESFGKGEKSTRQKILTMSIALPTPTRPGSDLEKNGVLTFGMPRGEELLAILNVKKEDYNSGFEAAVKARNDLQRLLELRNKIKTSDGLAEEMYKLGFGIFGKGGQVSQLAAMLASQDVDDPNKDTTEAFQQTIQQVFNKTNVDELGEIESLKISLAFTLARAADPSGRLSNQDFEVQLRRLGAVGIFTNVGSQIAAIQKVLADTQDLVDSKSLLYDIYNKSSVGGSNVLSEKERRIIYAAKNYHKIRKEVETVGGAMSQGEFRRKSTDLNSSGEPLFVPITDPNDPNKDTHVLNTDTGEIVLRSLIKDGDKI